MNKSEIRPIVSTFVESGTAGDSRAGEGFKQKITLSQSPYGDSSPIGASLKAASVHILLTHSNTPHGVSVSVRFTTI